MSESGVLRFIASIDDDPVGSVVYCPPYERQLGDRIIKNIYPEMRLLSVLPNFRNKGIANWLIEACEGQAQVQNAEAITLHTTSLMAVARAMYERRGYTRYSEIDFEPVPGFTVLGYIKKLTRGEHQDEQR
jgi:ribosomal protein S18 acetylase RimI-like enzyme